LEHYVPNFLFHCPAHRPYLRSFPTRRSSDLLAALHLRRARAGAEARDEVLQLLALLHLVGVLGLDARADLALLADHVVVVAGIRSEEHTSELQSQSNLVCRLLLDKKKNKT